MSTNGGFMRKTAHFDLHRFNALPSESLQEQDFQESDFWVGPRAIGWSDGAGIPAPRPASRPPLGKPGLLTCPDPLAVR